MIFYPLAIYGKKATQGCPCGHLGDDSGRCRCTVEQVDRYRKRISGPLLDRIDMHVEVPRQRPELTHDQKQAAESSSQVAKRVARAIDLQRRRQGSRNHLLDVPGLEQHAHLDLNGQRLLQKASEQLRLSTRAYHRIIKVARTIADLEAEDCISAAHLSEAIGFRRLDRS